MRLLFTTIVFIISCLRTYAQVDSLHTDSIQKAKEEQKRIYSAPRRASIKSAILPGLGQIQNKKYWKVPIIYAAIGGFSYLFHVNNIQYQSYRSALITSLDNGGRAAVDGVDYTTANLQVLKKQYKKSRDFAGIGIAIIYILNIVDANVDAHLKTFDISDDLSMEISPREIFYTGPFESGVAGGIAFTFKFRK